MTQSINYEDLTPLQKLKYIKKYDNNDRETEILIKIIEKALHKELELMLDNIRKNIKAGIFMSNNMAIGIYKAEDVEKFFYEKLIEVDGHEN